MLLCIEIYEDSKARWRKFATFIQSTSSDGELSKTTKVDKERPFDFFGGSNSTLGTSYHSHKSLRRLDYRT
jgi:hypothetical protein